MQLEQCGMTFHHCCDSEFGLRRRCTEAKPQLESKSSKSLYDGEVGTVLEPLCNRSATVMTPCRNLQPATSSPEPTVIVLQDSIRNSHTISLEYLLGRSTRSSTVSAKI